MKITIKKLGFSFIIILMNAFPLKTTYSSSQLLDEQHAPHKISVPEKEKPELSSKELHYEIKTLETTIAVKNALKKWHESKKSPSLMSSFWYPQASWDCFDSSLIDYKRTDKNRNISKAHQEELLAQNNELDDYLADHGLSMLAHTEIQDSSMLILSALSVDVDQAGEREVFQKSNPLFIESLTLKGKKLTRSSYTLVESMVLRLPYLTSLSLEFDHFGAGMLGEVLSRLHPLTTLILSGSLNTAHLKELSKLPKLLENLEELELTSTSKEPDPLYIQTLMKIFQLTPDLKVVGLSESINLPLDNLSVYNGVLKHLKKLHGLRLKKLTTDPNKLRDYLEPFRWIGASRFQFDLSDNLLLMGFIEQAFQHSKALPAAST